MTSLRPSSSVPSNRSAQPTHFVLGDEHVALAIADRLRADGHAVKVVEEPYDPADGPGVEGSPTDVELISESGLESAKSVIIGTRSDARNLLIAQLVRVHFEVPRIIVLVNNPDRLAALTEAGHEPLCVPSALSEKVLERV